MEKQEFNFMVVYFDGESQILAGACHTFEEAVEYARKREKVEDGGYFNIMPADEETRNMLQALARSL